MFGVVLSLAVALVTTDSANAQSKPVYVTKFYDVADLLDPPFMLDDGSEPAPSAGFGGGLGGGGGFGGGGGAPGGGGMFRIPDNVLPQFGGGGGMGGGME